MNKFLTEILEQPEALKKTLAYYTDGQGKNTLKELKGIFDRKSSEQIIFTGMGSSNYTSMAASTLFNTLGIPAFSVNTSELLHYNLGLLKKPATLSCFSQSGESYEIREILKKIPEGTFTVGITNEDQSTLAKQADVALFSKAGKEKMTSTKSYITTALVSFILGWYLSGKWDDKRIKAIKDLTDKFSEKLEHYDIWVNEAIDFMGELPALSIIARGPGISTAMQSGLMFKETTKIPAFGILGGEFRHGPMEMVQEGFKSILFASEGRTLDQSLKMAKDIAGFGGKVLLITNTKAEILHKNILVIPISEQDEFLFSIQSIIPIQLFIDSYAKQKGYEAGDFTHGAKVTEIE
jgi:glucosamine--fructose-6-phosphate aminotransferase (isomerizing)